MTKGALPFFHLMLVRSIGTGLLIGSFTHGKVQYGMLHTLIMLGISAAVSPWLVMA